MLKILEESVDDEEQQQHQEQTEMPKAGLNKKYVGSYRREKALKWCRAHLTSASVSVGGDNLTLATFKDASAHEEFLWCLFQLFDEDGDQLIDQVVFLENLHKRLPDEKGRQFCEVLETATFATVRDQYITPANFAQIFATKGVLDKFYRLMNRDGSDGVKITSAMDFIAQLTISRMNTSLTKENIEYLHQVFKENCGDNKEIGFESFRKIVHSKNNFFTERVFQMFDRDGSGSVSWQEFLDAVNDISGDSMDNRIKFLFGIYDVDGDGFIQIEELRLVLKACMDENGMKFSEEQIDDLTTALFEDADTFGRGAITLEALKAQLEKHEGLLENLTYSVGRWLVPPKPSQKTTVQRIADLKPTSMDKNYIKNNYAFMGFVFCFLAINAALFISRAYEYRDYNGFVIVARACGQCLNFTCMFIVIMVLRKCITFLRARGCTKVLPLDDHIYLHKLTGWFVFAYSVGHTAAHIANLAYTAALDHDDDVLEEVIEDLFTSKKGLGLVGVAYPTGVALIIILCIMVLCSQNFVRKGGRFEVFYWTHRLYVAFFILTILHTPNFWKWFVAPGIIFIIELLVRFIQRRTGHGKTVILEGVLLPSKVTHLVIKRPSNFYFHPGDYIFVKIPTIAKYEWHPFTVSSAPEQEDCLWLHIRGVGEWTNSLYAYMEKQQLKLIASKGSVAIDLRGGSKYRRRTILSHRNMSQRSHKVLFTPPVQSMEPVGGPEVKITLSPDSENGFVNLGFGLDNGNRPLVPDAATGERESEKGVAEIRKKSEDALAVDNLGVDSHARIAASKSLPPCPNVAQRASMQGLHKQANRSASSELDTVQVLMRNSSSPMCVRQRSRGQSFRHLRKKPHVVHLSFPSNEEESTAGAVVPTAPTSPVMSPTGSEGHNQVECVEEFASEKPLEIFIDGPYGAPSSHIFRAEHAVLVGTGIGVTPFASILQSIMRRYWKAQQKCPRCEYCWTNNVTGVLNLKKVDFFWINRDQKSFEWFVNLLSQLEIEQAEQGGAMERFLDMHMYITSAHQKTDMQAVGLHLALDLLHEKEKRDLITGLKTRTQAGRPNWNKVFKKIAEQNKGKVTVFFCGPVQMAKSLKITCQKFGFAFKKEIF